MRIYRDGYTDKNGKRRKSAKWYVDFTDHKGKRHRIPGFTEKRLTQKLGDNLESLVACKIAGQRPDGDLQRWIDTLPDKLLKKVIGIGLIDFQRAEVSKLLTDHIEDYKEVMAAKGSSKSHIEGTVSRIKAISNDRGFEYIRDISPAEVTKYIGKLRQDGRTATTRNHYLTAFKMFMNWLKEERRISENPISHLKKEKAESEKRGALTQEQFSLLIEDVTLKGIARRKVSAHERAMLYLMAGVTGIRRSELLRLIWSDIDFRKHPCVNIDGSKTKNKKKASQPLPKYVAELFSQWKKEKGAKDDDSVFDGINYHCRPSEWIRADLKEAGLPIEDYMGNKIDFHSLRNTYISFLANSNTPPKLIQKLARHSSIDLTMNIYARTDQKAEQAAIDNLPVPHKPKDNKKEADKTDDNDKKGKDKEAEK